MNTPTWHPIRVSLNKTDHDIPKELYAAVVWYDLKSAVNGEVWYFEREVRIATRRWNWKDGVRE